MENLKRIDQIRVFNIFHDGTIIQFFKSSQKIYLKIEIEYLAELINSNFTSLICELINCEEINFKFWDEESNTIKDLALLKKFELEIIDAEVIDDKIVVKCLSNINAGGNLYIKTENIKVYDQEKRVIPISKLTEVSRLYWNKI